MYIPKLQIYTFSLKTVLQLIEISVGDDGASYHPSWEGKEVKKGGSAGIGRYELHFLHQL